jgi:hypothetical protein
VLLVLNQARTGRRMRRVDDRFVNHNLNKMRRVTRIRVLLLHDVQQRRNDGRLAVHDVCDLTTNSFEGGRSDRSQSEVKIAIILIRLFNGILRTVIVVWSHQ